jgi:SRSO17 transposase
VSRFQLACYPPQAQRVRANKWCKFERIFSDGKSENRYVREIIYGKKRAVIYGETITDSETMLPNSTSFVKTNFKGKLKKIVGNLYELKTWVE